MDDNDYRHSSRYRTPEEIAEQRAEDLTIDAVIARAIDDGVLLIAAMELEEDPEVVERLINRVHDNIRDAVRPGPHLPPDPERLIRMVVCMTARHAEDTAMRLVHNIEDTPAG
jgi:hypothetical protein